MNLSTRLERIDDFISFKIMLLPLVLTEKSKSRAIRTLGYFASFIWIFPAIVIFAIPLFGLMMFQDFLKTWNGPSESN